MENRVITICDLLQKLTIEEIEEIEAIAKRQTEYIHPLKNATARKQNILGDHNQKVMKQIRILYGIMQEGKEKLMGIKITSTSKL